ncbi:hypothetical protein [Pseudomonas sp. PSE14]|uniref:hypothetical protein n=1 Tax=Pseudomonas sp. PSE14 TaxID=3016341 RepID=UPI0023D7D2F2|nr:hypothetical protein [Pseudomonas sp. PSE14]WEJ70321.1 hypothetical protein O6P39_16755 [Pseudomonas sp. PSE14]
MSNERGLAIHLAYLDSMHKFDHFLLGASLAACAYLAQTNPFGKVGCNVETMYLIALAALAFSSYAGFRRLEAVTAVLRMNSEYLEAPLTPAGRKHAAKLIDKVSERTNRWYKIRNGFLYAGFLAYIGTKVIATYLQP